MMWKDFLGHDIGVGDTLVSINGSELRRNVVVRLGAKGHVHVVGDGLVTRWNPETSRFEQVPGLVVGKIHREDLIRTVVAR